MSRRILYLGSQSKSRQKLLDLAEISYKVLKHDSDECIIDPTLSFAEYVLAIAREKMRHLTLPKPAEEQEILFVLTADTLVKTTQTDRVLEKPTDKEDAKRMLRLLRVEPAEVVTACCLEKKSYQNGSWQTAEKKELVLSCTVEFFVPEEDLDAYLEKEPLALRATGAGVIEGYGMNFVKSVHGSYAAVLGLPLYELRAVLKEMGFYTS